MRLSDKCDFVPNTATLSQGELFGQIPQNRIDLGQFIRLYGSLRQQQSKNTTNWESICFIAERLGTLHACFWLQADPKWGRKMVSYSLGIWERGGGHYGLIIWLTLWSNWLTLQLAFWRRLLIWGMREIVQHCSTLAAHSSCTPTFYHGPLPERQSHGHGASCFSRGRFNS